MDQPESRSLPARDVWEDHKHEQEFEHDLINRKTTWLLATQSLLFTAYGVTLGSEDPNGVDPDAVVFRKVAAGTGLLVAFVVLGGVLGLIRSKYLSWCAYRAFFKPSGQAVLPGPLENDSLKWGVQTGTTILTLLPEVALPCVFILAWGIVLLST